MSDDGDWTLRSPTPWADDDSRLAVVAHLMVLITVALVVVQEMCSRLGTYTGEGLGGLIREQFSARSTTNCLVRLAPRRS